MVTLFPVYLPENKTGRSQRQHYVCMLTSQREKAAKNGDHLEYFQEYKKKI